MTTPNPFSLSFQEHRLLSQQMGIGFREGPRGPQQEGPKNPRDMITAADNAAQMEGMRSMAEHVDNAPQEYDREQAIRSQEYPDHPELAFADQLAAQNQRLTAHEQLTGKFGRQVQAANREMFWVDRVIQGHERAGNDHGMQLLAQDAGARWDKYYRFRNNPGARAQLIRAMRDSQRVDMWRQREANMVQFGDIQKFRVNNRRIDSQASLAQEQQFPTEEKMVFTPVDMPVGEQPQPVPPRGPQFAPPQRTDRGFMLGRPGEEGTPPGPEGQPMPELSPELAKLVADLTPDVQRSMARLINGMSPAEKKALEEVGGKLQEILKDPQSRNLFMTLPILDLKTGKINTKDLIKDLQSENTKKELAKDNIPPEAVKKVTDFLSGLSPEQATIFARFFRNAHDIAQEQERKTEGYSLDLEKNPAKKAEILKYAKRFTEAKTEEDKLIAEGKLRTEGVDVDGSDFASGKVEMLPTSGGARFINLIVGFVQMTMGILKKLGGKKTPTQSVSETSIQGWRGVAESKETVKKLDTDIKNLEELLKKPNLAEEERRTYTESLGKLKDARKKLQSSIEDQETRLRRLDKMAGLEEHKEGTVVTQQAGRESADTNKDSPTATPAPTTERPQQPAPTAEKRTAPPADPDKKAVKGTGKPEQKEQPPQKPPITRDNKEVPGSGPPEKNDRKTEVKPEAEAKKK